MAKPQIPIEQWLETAPISRKVITHLIKFDGDKRKRYPAQIADALGIGIPPVAWILKELIKGRVVVAIPQKWDVFELSSQHETRKKRIRIEYKMKDINGFILGCFRHYASKYANAQLPAHTNLLNDSVWLNMNAKDLWRYACAYGSIKRNDEDYYFPLEDIPKKNYEHLKTMLKEIDKYEDPNSELNIYYPKRLFDAVATELCLRSGNELAKEIVGVIQNRKGEVKDYGDLISDAGLLMVFLKLANLKEQLLKTDEKLNAIEDAMKRPQSKNEIVDYFLSFLKDILGSELTFTQLPEKQRRFYWNIYLLLLCIRRIYNAGATTEIDLSNAYLNLPDKQKELVISFAIQQWKKERGKAEKIRQLQENIRKLEKP